MLNKSEHKTLSKRASLLKPVILIGQKGLSDAVHAEINTALTHHELIKIKMAGADKTIRENMTNTILEKQTAELIQSIGGTIVIYRKASD